MPGLLMVWSSWHIKLTIIGTFHLFPKIAQMCWEDHFLLSVGFLQQTFLSYYCVQRCIFSYPLHTILPTQSKPLLFPITALTEKGINLLSFTLRQIRCLEKYWSVDDLSCSVSVPTLSLQKGIFSCHKDRGWHSQDPDLDKNLQYKILLLKESFNDFQL